jgi:RNA polymerase sigma-70 factor (ECF subfamily)
MPAVAPSRGQDDRAELSSPEDQQLIETCLTGDSSAFGELVVRYQDRLYGSVLMMVSSPEDARDLTQEAFVHAFRRLDSFRGNSAFYTWLFRIAINATISFRRKMARRKMVSIEKAREVIGEEPRDGRVDTPPSSRMESQEQQRLVRAALGELSEEFRTAIVLTEIEGMSYEDAAEVIGCPIGTVRSRIHRARNELREKLRLLLKDEGE